MAWSGKRPEAGEWIQWELSRRLSAANDVLNGLRDAARPVLFRWPPKFNFPPHADTFRHPEISRLIFITRYESFTGGHRRLRNCGLSHGMSGSPRASVYPP
ncbi:hypothetical protein [Methanogenium cariaci]|uniref:hypothetical protein n=1 Tax=Methanogenium cariaci TaxID=2197 RepID=UPI0012F6254D|nr:hypothetical protein [Methanogenium cariaci]